MCYVSLVSATTTNNDVLAYRHVNGAFSTGIQNHQLVYAFIHFDYALDPSIVSGCWVTTFVDRDADVRRHLFGRPHVWRSSTSSTNLNKQIWGAYDRVAYEVIAPSYTLVTTSTRNDGNTDGPAASVPANPIRDT